jgi:hypothetical protein
MRATILCALLCAGCAVPHDVSVPLTRDDCELPPIGTAKAAALAAVAPCWGKPHYNQTITGSGMHEQAVFTSVVLGDAVNTYMYFDNGKLTRIQP